MNVSDFIQETVDFTEEIAAFDLPKGIKVYEGTKENFPKHFGNLNVCSNNLEKPTLAVFLAPKSHIVWRTIYATK